MELPYIDRVARIISGLATRRSALGLVSGLGLSGLVGITDDAEAKKKKKKKKHKQPQKPPPDDGCDTRVSTAAELLTALALAPGCGSGYYRICLAAGTYDCATMPDDPLGIGLGCTSLIGAGPTQTILKRDGVGGVVVSSYQASMRDLTVTGGGDGGIFNASLGDLTLTNCIIRGNESSQGGGIFNIGHLTLNDCTITENVATTSLNTGKGGGVRNDGTLVRSNTTISGNTADVAGTADCFNYDGGIGC